MRRFFSFVVVLAVCASVVSAVNAQTFGERLHENLTSHAQAAAAPGAASLGQILKRQKPALGASEPVDTRASAASSAITSDTPVLAFSMADGIAAAGAALLGVMAIVFLLLLVASSQRQSGDR
jgi:hypothetical protein